MNLQQFWTTKSWYFPTQMFRKKYCPCTIRIFDCSFYAKMYDRKKKKEKYDIWFSFHLLLMKVWSNLLLTSQKKKPRKYSYVIFYLLFLNINHTFHILDAKKNSGPTYFEHFELGIWVEVYLIFVQISIISLKINFWKT